MDWGKGFSSTYYLTVVDRFTWKDSTRIEITGGTIKHTLDDLRDAADLNCIDYDADTEQLIRVWLDAKQEDDSSHTPLFTGIATSPGIEIKGTLTSNKLECYSVLKIAQDILLPRGWYAAKGTNTGYLIQSLLKDTGAPIDIPESTPNLDQAIIAENGENKLSMVDKIINAMGNWQLYLTGYGEIIVDEISNEPVAIFGALSNDVIEPSVSITYDWYGCPNVYRAVADDTYAVARDDDPDSPYSTVSRGREVWYEDTDCYISDGESLADYAKRALREAQQVATEVSYTRRFDPDVMVGDVIRINYPAQDIFGDYIVKSQSIDLGYGARVSEEVHGL